MKTITKAFIFGIITEAIPASFVIIDHFIGVEAVSRAAHDQASFNNGIRAAPLVFYFLAQSTHMPAVYALGYCDMLMEAVLGVSGGKPIFFAGFGTPYPAWGLICTTQAIICVAFWGVMLAVIQYFSRRVILSKHEG